jgi:uncharacterized Fe-S center protein
LNPQKKQTMASQVYFMSPRTSNSQNLLQKLSRMLEKAAFADIPMEKKMVALKLHFGEPGNLAFLRPNFATTVAGLVKERGGLPFLTDSNTLYKGSRSNAVDHIRAAAINGYTQETTGCPVIIADGIKGTDYEEIEINLPNCKTAKIGKAIADADVIISLNHFKGHGEAGFGGCLKNIGMGSGSVAGKHEMHSDSKPAIVAENCTGCAMCEENCAHDAVHLNDENIAVINYDTCTGCGQCVAVCRYDSAQVQWSASRMQEKIAEYAFAVLNGKPAFHINFLLDISPNCDCWPHSDAPIVPNIGILASSDPVALDVASAELVTASQGNAHSELGEHIHAGTDKFTHLYPHTNWNTCVAHAEKIGLGSMQYDLIKLD